MDQASTTASDRLLHAAINCEHRITDACVELRFDDSKPGLNALDQLDHRLAAALATATSALQEISWAPIDTAPKDGSVILVDDLTAGGSQWVAAKWLAGEAWSGWVYDDAMLSDSSPLGPCPTKWLRGLK